MSQIIFDASHFKARCSSISKIMSNSRSNPPLTENQAKKIDELEAKSSLTDKQKLELAELLIKRDNSLKVVLSDTAITYLMEWYAYETAQKKSVMKEFDMDYTRKGKEVEEDSITLLSRVERIFYAKNTERVENDFLSGEPDLFTGESIYKAERITDIKSVFDYPGFLQKIHAGLDNGYSDQVAGYMDITGANQGELAYCLVNTPETMVNDFKRRLMYKMNVATDESPEYLIAAAKLESYMYFDDIPMNKRVFKMDVPPFTEHRRQAIYDRVKVCREWLNEFHEQYEQFNK